MGEEAGSLKRKGWIPETLKRGESAGSGHRLGWKKSLGEEEEGG